LIGFATMAYDENSKQLLRAYKELGESSLASQIAIWVSPLLSCFVEQPSHFVPVPSNRLSERERGFNPAEVVAREISRLHPEVPYRNLLSRSRTTQDQSKLNPQERLENQFQSMVAMAGSESVVLIDDVVTTGATLLAASNSLQSAGHRVIGFLAFAETEANGCNLSTQATKPADGGTSWN
jgi:ComF family protein